MNCRILIVPDKFKGTLTAAQAARAIASGWLRARPGDQVDLQPMSDGGDGYGEILSPLLHAVPQTVVTVDAAHRPIRVRWWWNSRDRVAVIESALVIGLARLPKGYFHPFQLDTFGLARVFQDAAKRGATAIHIGIGGSATNDGGFGLARGMGWRFHDEQGSEILEWWQLNRLASATPPGKSWDVPVTVGVDVNNRLLGPRGCSAVYGPQKGLRSWDLSYAEGCLNRLRRIVRESVAMDFATKPGAGAAGGLGFGLMAFLGAKCESGFELFARFSDLKERIRAADCVVTGEGAIDAQTFMGKGVGEVVRLCRQYKVSCLGLAGRVETPDLARRYFTHFDSLVPFGGRQEG